MLEDTSTNLDVYTALLQVKVPVRECNLADISVEAAIVKRPARKRQTGALPAYPFSFQFVPLALARQKYHPTGKLANFF